MKRLIAAGILIAVIAAICVTGSLVVRRTGERVGGFLTQALEAARAGDVDGAARLARQAEAAYMEAEAGINGFVHHDLVEELGAQIARLPALAAPDTLDEFISEAQSTAVMLTHVVKDESPCLRNVL